MGLFGFSKSLFPQSTAYQGVVAHYQRLRPLRLRLNDELVRRLTRDVLDKGAKKLGMLRGGMFVFDNEDQSSVLMDYCLYDVYRKGRNAVDQYVRDCPPDANSDETSLLNAMQQATYSLVVVLRVEPGVGCHVRNLFTDETRLLADIGLSRSAQPGVLLATRLLDFGGFVTTSGAALPVGVLSNDETEEWKRKLSAGAVHGRFDPAQLIRDCLQMGASSNIRYEGMNTESRSDVGEGFGPSGTSAQRSRAIAERPVGKAVANRRCRCGSGKMFKNCCGKCENQFREGR